MKRRVVVTGLGAVTPIGNDVESFWNGVKEGKVGIGPITRFDSTGYKATLAAELKDFVAKDRMDPRTARRMEPFSQYAVAAALEAMENSGLKMEEEDPYMVGVIYRYRCKGKMYQRGNSMCDRNTLHRRCFSCHSVW